LDTQRKELVGRAALEAELIKHGFEVARPYRDKGIDLIAYLDEPSSLFFARPIQLKAASATPFGLDRKYEKIGGIVLAYVWNIFDTPRFFLMNYKEAEAIIPDARKQTPSWAKGGWSWKKAPREVEIALKPFENRWEWLRAEIRGSASN